jgi:hypothetical protein
MLLLLYFRKSYTVHWTPFTEDQIKVCIPKWIKIRHFFQMMKKSSVRSQDKTPAGTRPSSPSGTETIRLVWWALSYPGTNRFISNWTRTPSGTRPSSPSGTETIRLVRWALSYPGTNRVRLISIWTRTPSGQESDNKVGLIMTKLSQLPCS